VSAPAPLPRRAVAETLGTTALVAVVAVVAGSGIQASELSAPAGRPSSESALT
jgi:hypothetical protein